MLGVEFDQIRNFAVLTPIRLSNLVDFEFRDQIRPRIRISNSTFLAEFRIILSRIRNSSELSMRWHEALNK